MINKEYKDLLLIKTVDIQRDVDNLMDASLSDIYWKVNEVADQLDELYKSIDYLEVEEWMGNKEERLKEICWKTSLLAISTN